MFLPMIRPCNAMMWHISPDGSIQGWSWSVVVRLQDCGGFLIITEKW